MQPLLTADNLFKTYGHGDIFRGVSFALNPDETLGLFGMSGSGKSTLGRCLIGLENLSGGKVTFSGEDLSNLSARRLRSVRPGMQMIFQHPEVSMDPRMRLIDSVTEPLMYHRKQKKDDVFAELLPLIRAVGLRPDQFFCYPNQLSGGEIQRAMMVKVYSLSPKLIVADEPTSMLDMSVQAQILTLMQKLQRERKTACVFISHDPEVMQMMCDCVGVLKQGKFTLMNMDEFEEYTAENYLNSFHPEKR